MSYKRKELVNTYPTDVLVEKLAGLLTMEQIGDFFGLSDDALRARFKADPKLKAAYWRGRAQRINKVADKLYQKCMRGDTTSIIFFLKTQGRWKEHNVIELGRMAEMSDEELARIAAGETGG